MTHPLPQPLDQLLTGAGLEAAAGQSVPQIAVTGVAIDSRALEPGDLFVALAGAGTHGLRFVEDRKSVV